MGVVMTAFMATMGVALALGFLAILSLSLAVIGGWLADISSEETRREKDLNKVDLKYQGHPIKWGR